MSENLMTLRDVAKALQKSENAIRMLRYRGVLPNAIKIGKAIYFRESDFENMLNKNQEVKKKKVR